MYEQKYLKYKAKYLALKKQLGSGTSPSTLIQLGVSSLPPIDPSFYNVINNQPPAGPNPDFVRIIDGQSVASQLGNGMSPSTLIQLATTSVPPVPPSFYNTINEIVSSDVPLPANAFSFPIRG
jgi:hypothetical protein